MLLFHRYHKCVSIIVVLLSLHILAAPITQSFAQEQVQQQEQTQQQEPSASEIMKQAETDASQDQSGVGYGIGGFLCGVFGWILAATSNPDVPAARLVSKSPNYVVIYAEAYKSKTRSIRKTSACIGWGIGTAVSLGYLAATGGFETDKK